MENMTFSALESVVRGDVTRNIDYIFMENAYRATGGFKNGRYIIKRSRETTKNYKIRQQLAYYLNYVKPIIDSHVNPVFREDASRDWGGRQEQGTNLFSAFFNDVDTKGTKLPRFMKRAARMAKIYGSAFIVIDNIKDQPGSMAEVISQRAFPYLYLVKPQDVSRYTVNKAGVLTSISYTVAGDGSGSVGIQPEYWEWTTTTWQCNADGQQTSGTHGLNKVPVIPLLGAESDPGFLKPQSDFWSVAQTNKRIYNLCSEIDEIITKQAFSIFTYPIGENTDKNEVQDMLVGTENAITFDGSLTHAPGFATPDAMPLEQLRSERHDLIQEIYRMAERSQVAGTGSKNSSVSTQSRISGVSRAWDFEGANQVLADFAEANQTAEYSIAALFGLWTHDSVQYICTYPADFGMIDVASALEEVTKALELNIGGLFNMEVKKKAVDIYLKDIAEDRYDAVIQDIENAAKDDAYKFDGNPIVNAISIMTGVANETIAPEAAVILMQSFFGMTEETALALMAAQQKIVGVAAKQAADAQKAAADAQVNQNEPVGNKSLNIQENKQKMPNDQKNQKQNEKAPVTAA